MLLALSVLSTRVSQRLAIPVPLVFLSIGMLAGLPSVGNVHFNDVTVAFRIGVAALVLILFDGGLNTNIARIRGSLAPAVALASLGVVGTTAAMGFAAHLLGFSWPTALLLGAIVAPTDVASVFAILRASGVTLRRRVDVTLELESGLNDPTSVMLTTILTANFGRPVTDVWLLAIHIVLEIAVGLAGGAAIGYGGRFILRHVRLTVRELYPVFTIALALLAFSAPTLLSGSGFLATYVAAIILGGGPLPYRTQLARMHDALAWLGQVMMFVVLGLLVTPSSLTHVAGLGLVLSLILAFLARPVVTAAILLPFGFTWRENLFLGFSGIRGAVPVILATIPLTAGVLGAEGLFDLVLVMVVVNAIVPGAMVPWFSRLLKVTGVEPPQPPATLELHSELPLSSSVRSFHVDPSLAIAGTRVSDIPLPQGSAVTLIARGGLLLPPDKDVRLDVGDHVYVLIRAGDEAYVQLLFGNPEE